MIPCDPSRIVVRAPNWVGDAVMSVAALRKLRCLVPRSHITVVSKPGTADVFAEADFVDEVLIYDRRGLASAFGQARIWKRRSFGIALLFQNAFEAAAIAYLARIPLRMGYDTERRGSLLTHRISIPSWRAERHEIFYYLNIVDEFNVRVLGDQLRPSIEPDFHLDVSEGRQQQAREILALRGAGDNQPLVLLCPGSVNSRAKRWPAERYAALSDQFAETGAKVALIGAPSELDVSLTVAALTRHPPTILTGKTSVSEVIALISIADVLITNDTGPAHIGAAVGTPTLVIFGPTNPLTTRPFGAAAEIVREPPECAPCMLRDCPIDHRCMTVSAPDDVYARAQQVMRRRLEVAV